MLNIKKKSAFTLVEVLISIGLSSFILVSMFKLYQNIVSNIDYSREAMILNRKACLLFEQLERDISASFIPFLHQKDSEKNSKDKKQIKFFEGKIYEDLRQRINKKYWDFFKNINFITTNPLDVYNQKKVRFVRVMYELVKDKKASTKDIAVYSLFRKETLDLKNAEFKVPEEDGDKNYKKINKYLVADKVKSMFVKYITIEEKKEKERKTFFDPRKTVDTQSVSSFVWGEKKESKDKGQEKQVVPAFVFIKIIFWDDKLKSEHSFETTIPIFSFPTLQLDEKKQAQKADENKDDTAQNTSAANNANTPANQNIKNVPSPVSGGSK